MALFLLSWRFRRGASPPRLYKAWSGAVPNSDMNCHWLAVFCQPACVGSQKKQASYITHTTVLLKPKPFFAWRTVTKVTRSFGLASAI